MSDFKKPSAKERGWSKEENDYLEQFNDLTLLVWKSKTTNQYGWQIRKESDDSNEAISWCEASHRNFKTALVQARENLIQKIDEFPYF